MDTYELRFVTVEKDRFYNLDAYLIRGNNCYLKRIEVNFPELIIETMEEILKKNNIIYKGREFDKFIKEFKKTKIENLHFTKYCCSMIYEYMSDKLADAGILIKGGFPSLFGNSGTQILDDYEFYRFIACCDFRVLLRESFLKHSTLFLQVFAIINKRTIEAKVDGINYKINSEQIQEITT